MPGYILDDFFPPETRSDHCGLQYASAAAVTGLLVQEENSPGHAEEKNAHHPDEHENESRIGKTPVKEGRCQNDQHSQRNGPDNSMAFINEPVIAPRPVQPERFHDENPDHPRHHG